MPRWFYILLSVVVVASLGIGTPTWVAAAPASPEDVPVGETVAGLQIGRYLFNMLAALALILAIIYLLYRFVSARKASVFSSGPIKPVAGYAFGTNRSIQVVQLAGKVYLLGVGENVQLLRLIDDQEEIAQLIHDPQQVPDFQQSLRSQVDRLRQNRDLILQSMRQRSRQNEENNR